ncbi:MAG: heavy metal transporter [Clostridiales bacterium]|jgi:cation transport ATPase|nr:heavy metal transporter [Clostridiales bacterium]HOK81910.1 cation transporter [Clostridia bacterium]HOL61571.1 cation transporter [Clostridia bacterium]HPO54200.1 cation transporter [Clostridia bacterium]
MRKIARIENLDCAVCAAKLEKAISDIAGVNAASLNFISQRLSLDINDAEYASAVEKIHKVAKKLEPDCVIKGL